MRLESIIYTAVFLLSIVSALVAHGLEPVDVPNGKPAAVIDLSTREGVELVKGQWLYSDVEITEVDFKGPGADGQPTGEPVKTYDYTPKAGASDYDDSKWEKIAPGTLNKRRSTGRICFNWYRIRVTVPESVDGFATTGSTVVFETAIDDYAEVWVNGEIARYLGQEGGSVIAGWNTANRLVIGRDVKPGETIQLAVFGMNGPISNPPTNFIWMREAKLEFYEGSEAPIALTPSEVNVEVIRLDPAMDAIAGPNPKIFKLAEGFKFTEGPVWVNGLALDKEGRLTIDEHGNHRVSRIEKDGTVTVLAESYEGKRLNSPNDLVYKSDGSVYFTDPPFGLPMFENDSRKEIPWSGVYRISPGGEIVLLNKELKGPNGIAFSPDEKYLYVGNWDPENKVVMRYDVMEDGTLSDGERFFDMTGAPGEDSIDGVKVDSRGNLYVSGPGGLWVISAGGKHIGTIIAPKHVHNMAWGGEDGKTLFLCARSGLYMMRLGIQGGKCAL